MSVEDRLETLERAVADREDRISMAVDFAKESKSETAKALERIDALEHQLETARTELATLKLEVEEFTTNRDFQDMTDGERVDRIRSWLYERAAENRGRSAEYSDIRDSVFDGAPSPPKCYELMRKAAGVDGDGNEIEPAPGFEFRNPPSGNYQLQVVPERVAEFYFSKKESGALAQS